MASLENPIGIKGLAFLEFAELGQGQVEKLLGLLEMKKVGFKESVGVELYRQNEIYLLAPLKGQSQEKLYTNKFAKAHGPSIASMAFWVQNAKVAFEQAVKRGARPFPEDGGKTFNSPAVYGIGDAILYFVEAPKDLMTYFESQGFQINNVMNTDSMGLLSIDHLTNNVPKGEMDKWKNFYSDIFGFREVRYFDIKGKSTGLLSRAMQSPCSTFSIPINEPADQKSQIQEYLDEYKGSGVQHVAFASEDITLSVERMRKKGIKFLAAPPQTYYDQLKTRVTDFKGEVEPLQDLGVLVDGDDKSHLLQIFTQNQVGPIFLEVIERQGHMGFGDGNFQALFDAMEEDQRRRGKL